MQVDLKHTLTVDRSAWYIRFYVWLWEANLNEITFCKLFWAYIFTVPGLILRFCIAPPLAALNEVVERHKASRAKLAKPAKAKTPRMQPFLEHVETTGSRAAMMLASIWRVVGLQGRVAAVAGRLLVWAGAAAGIAATGGIIYLAVTNFNVTEWVLVGIGGLAAAVVFGMVLAAMGIFERFGNAVTRGALSIKHGFLGFRDVMKTGYVAVKSNTCPRIDVK